MAPSDGDRVGNYRIETELGPTGCGILFAAQHLVLPRQAILKVVHPAFAAYRPYVLQTLREACMLEAIAHPGIPIIYESGVLRDRRPWFAFEQVIGPTLDEVMAVRELELAEVASLLRDLAELFEHVHRRGVIHRGLRPDRIVFTPERRFPLCIPDWSEAIAHDAATDAPHVAPDGSGSYRSPELAAQLAGEPGESVDDRTDMFAIGVIGYRALTGQLPVAAAVGSPAPSARELRGDAPAELTGLVDSLLAFDRFDRPTASEIRADLQALIDTLIGAVPARGAAPAPRDSEPAWARAKTLPRIAPPASHATGTGPVPTAALDETPGEVWARGAIREDVALDPPRLRRPRWTPEVAYIEGTHVDISIADSDSPSD